MKLKKLTIENVASIERAEIDFSAAPLADERLFLITGETGSGKSTIIDCLCLALYGNTPRLRGAKSAKYESTNPDGSKEEEITTTNPKQLMRRGSVQASVTLTFDDNEGTPYVATWEVHRSRNKLEGRVMEATRCLRTDDGVIPPVHKTKIKEIDEHIGQLLGLDVDQFFRTVVLAQGRFAEFLNSGEKEKSDLLEKMTGTEIYTQLGKKIFEQCQQKANRCTILRGQMDNIVPLTEEQKAQINAEITQCSGEHKAVDDQLKRATAMHKWLQDKERIEQGIKNAHELLTDKMNQTAATDYQEENALVTDWESTTEARQRLKEHQQALGQIETLERQRPAMQEEFDRLCAALRASAAALNEKQKKADEIAAFLRQEEPNRAMYAAMGQIKSLSHQLKTERKNVTDFEQKAHEDELRLPTAQQAVATALKRCEAHEATAKALRQQQDEMHIGDISARKDLLTSATAALITLKDKHAEVTQAQDTLNELQKKHAEETEALGKEKEALKGKAERREEAWNAAEQQKTWNELINQAHQTLHEGDTCPVCGHVIDQLMPQGESRLEELQRKLKLADSELLDAQTRIRAAEKHLLDQRKLIENAERLLKQKSDDRERHWMQTRQLLTRCGKKARESLETAQADALIKEMNDEVQQLSAKLLQADKLMGQINEAQRLLNTANKAHTQALGDLGKVEESIRLNRKAQDLSKDKVQSLTDELNGLMAIPDWATRAEAEPDFIDRLEHAATGYKQQELASQTLANDIKMGRALIPAMEENKRNIMGLTDNGAITTAVPQGLDRMWNQFAKKNVEWHSTLNNCQQTAAKARQTLDGLLGSLDGMTLERLGQLNRHSQEAINGIKQRHQELNDAINNSRGALETLTRQQAELMERKPGFNEENPDRLEEIIADRQGALERLNTRLAELRTHLKVDMENTKRRESHLKELEQAEAEYAQWEQFNSILGDSTGSKFRRIAQSYILGDLLSSANEYLRQFNNRYELEASSGSLVILARDLVQGELTSVNTLSGGESFMVSLALALALSNMTGKIFTVDTLFIDEGFGSLSPNYLDNVMETLNRLYDIGGGRRVGIISHVEMLKERVPTQIQVTRDPNNNTASLVKVV